MILALGDFRTVQNTLIDPYLSYLGHVLEYIHKITCQTKTFYDILFYEIHEELPRLRLGSSRVAD